MVDARVVSRSEWLVARRDLLAREKEFTRCRDELAARRRSLPLVEIEKPYSFVGPAGEVDLLDLFEGRRQLVIYHFMFDPEWDEGCPSCSFNIDHIGDHLEHLHARDTTLVAVSRAPLPKLLAYRGRMGWTIPWYSSFGSDFNYDFHATLDLRSRPSSTTFPNARRAIRLTAPTGRSRRPARASSCAKTVASSTATRPTRAGSTSCSAPTTGST